MKQILRLLIPPNIARMSINHFLKTNNVSRRTRKRLSKEGVIEVDGQRIYWDQLLPQKGVLTCHMLEKESHLSWDSYAYPLTIVYEDEYIIVINKDAHMLMHPTSTERNNTLANALFYYYDQTKQSRTFHPVHRLDRDTSGLVVVTKTPVVQHKFSIDGTFIKKGYMAIVEGAFPSPYATVSWPIKRSEKSIITRCCHPDGAKAHTDIRRICIKNNMSLLQIRLHTGRTHQIRVHCATLGYPLVGDQLYGAHTAGRHALHAASLCFIHPITRELMSFSSPLPSHMRELLK